MRVFRWWVFALGATTGLAVAQAVVQDVDFASIKISIYTTFGEPVSRAQVTLTSIGPKETFSASGGEAKFDRIPFGLYDLDIRLPGFLPRKERIRIYQRNLALQIGLELAPTHVYERPELTGTVKSSAKLPAGLWARLVGLYTSDFAENAVDSSGTFELDGMARGKYLLIVLQKDTVVATKPLEIMGGKQRIEITLEP